MNTSVAAAAVAVASRLEINKGDQFIIGLDISGSMKSNDCPNGSSRLDYTMETLRTFCREADKYDPDGVSLYLFGAKVQAFPNMKADDITTKLGGKITTEGFTNTHLVIRRAYEEHLQSKSEQTFLMLFTDGEPSDQSAVVDTVRNIANSINDPLEFRICIITVGQRSQALDAWLSDLDNNLKNTDGSKVKNDIVTVRRLEDVDFISSLTEALEDGQKSAAVA